MFDLDEASKRWIQEEPRYADFGKYLEATISAVVQSCGIQPVVTHRTKASESLLGKLILKPDKTYDTITDKLGVRVVVHFRPLCDVVLDALKSSFSCQNIENKAAILGDDRVGYLGIHCDLSLRAGDPMESDFGGLSAEVQVRTLAEHLWADISHQLTYKSHGKQDPDLTRRIKITSGALELVDREFTRLHEEITTRSEYQEGVLLGHLEREFFRVVPRAYNRELSLEVMHALGDLYPKDQEAKEHVHAWFAANEGLVRSVYTKNADVLVRSPFLCQPEAFLMLDLLQHDAFRLRQRWNLRFPERELEIFAQYWGRTLD